MGDTCTLIGYSDPPKRHEYNTHPLTKSDLLSTSMSFRASPLLLFFVRAPSTEACVFCEFRRLHTSTRRLQLTGPEKSVPVSSKKPNRPHVRRWDGELIPKPLSRPLGLPYPPEPGQNTGRDTRSWRQRRDDFASYDKHLERRENLCVEFTQVVTARSIALISRRM